MNSILRQSLNWVLLCLFLFTSCKENIEKNNNDIISLREEYMKAWLSNDSLRVMNTLTKDAVLIPHHGDTPVESTKSIKEFWWPKDFPPSTVTIFESTYDEVKNNNTFGFLRGRFKLHFNYENKNHIIEGNYLNVVEKTEAGWKLSRLIWNDPPVIVE